jgi:pimeloyl-ACP methyl ester carboxylesterase
MAEQDFLPHHALVTAAGASPARFMLVLHGILGSGGNLRSFARSLAERCPDWGFALVDLRMHGLSQGAPPPHTVAAAAADLVRLEAALALPIAGVMGHSFGGKVSLAYLEQRRAAGAEQRRAAGAEASRIEQAWVLDASPSAEPERSLEAREGKGGESARGARRSESTEAVVRMLRGIPAPLPSRERFLEIVVEHGFSRSIAEWLARNVRRADDGFRLRLDLDAISALLTDYFATDLWHVLEQPGFADEIHMVIGGRSDALDASDRARLASLPGVMTHVLPEAGHWVHVDAPDALLGLVEAALRRSAGRDRPASS